MSKKVKKITREFIKKYKLTDINYSILKNVVSDMGYTVIEFDGIENDGDTEAIILNLGLSEEILKSRGFAYASRDWRLVFVNESLNDEEKLLVLAHETGHIVCEHFKNAPIIGKDVKDEYEANEFAHHLLNQNLFQKMNNLTTRHKKFTVSIVAVLSVCAVLLCTLLLLGGKAEYKEGLYITSTGNRYHKEDCIFIKNKTNSEKLTLEAFESGKYTPCDMCLPDKD